MRSKPALTYSVLFFLSGATGLIYELLWVRVLYQSFGSTIQSVTTVVAAYMGGLGLGAWLFGRRADRSPRPAVLYGWLEIAIGIFGILSPLILGLAHWVYIGTAGALALGGAGSVALRFGLAALALLIPTTLMGGTLPVLTRALTGEDRGLLKPSLGRLYGLNTLGAMTGTALAGFFLIEFLGVRASLLGTAVVNLTIGAAAIWLGQQQSLSDLVPQPAENQIQPLTHDHLRTVALVLLGLTAFASLLNEIAWTRVLIMIVGGSTYAFTLILLVFLLGIGLGSVIVARRSAPRAETAASAALAQGVTGVGAAALFVLFGFLPSYIIAVFQIPDLSAASRLLLMGVAVGAVVLIPAIGMGMTFPLLTDLTAKSHGAGSGRRRRLRTQHRRQHSRHRAHRICPRGRAGNAGDAAPRADRQRSRRAGPRLARRARRRGALDRRPPAAGPGLIRRGSGHSRTGGGRGSARLEHAADRPGADDLRAPANGCTGPRALPGASRRAATGVP